MVVQFLICSLIVGFCMSAAVGALNARMFYAPEVMAAGAFRTLGEINACNGDPTSHFSFGLSYWLSSWVNNMAYGGMGQDFLHRTVPNVGAGLLLLGNKNREETIQNPWKMFLVCGISGAILYAIMNVTHSIIPEFVTTRMMDVFTPAANYMMIIMQILYFIACLENGKYTAICGLVLGAIAYLATGNASAGLILGILTGKTIENNGIKSKISIVFIVLMIIIWGYICFARGFFGKAIVAFGQLSALFGGAN
ncbi:MAG: DUF4311 domain-containing protein [Erysipelotrichaceae bacterium]|nr:DUF4311 domain-containing protein [Erysipelotrichaceae bacterium]